MKTEHFHNDCFDTKRHCKMLNYKNDSLPEADSNLDKGTLHQIQCLYEKFNLCPAPHNFDTRTQALLSSFNGLVLSYLHLMYGDIIIPGVWSLNLNDSIIMRCSLQYEMTPATTSDRFLNTLDSFHEVMMYIIFRSTHNVHMMYLSVESRQETIKPNQRHAMILTIFKDTVAKTGKASDRIKVFLTDPRMRYDTDTLYDAQSVLKKYMKHFRLSPVRVLMKRVTKGKYQGLNSKAPYATIDRHGFCAFWALLIIESTARHVQTNSQYSMKTISTFDLSVPFTSGKAVIWRKLVKDYMFSRLVGIYALSKKIGDSNEAKIVSILEERVINKYLIIPKGGNENQWIGALVLAIMNYIPKFIEAKAKKEARKNAMKGKKMS